MGTRPFGRYIGRGALAIVVVFAKVADRHNDARARPERAASLADNPPYSGGLVSCGGSVRAHKRHRSAYASHNRRGDACADNLSLLVAFRKARGVVPHAGDGRHLCPMESALVYKVHRGASVELGPLEARWGWHIWLACRGALARR